MDTSSFNPMLTPDFIVRSLHLRIPALPRPHTPFTGVFTDSRKSVPGSLFVALQGKNYDGHDFIENAVANGARGILCQRGHSVVGSKNAYLFYVEDPLKAYRRVAAAWRKEFSIPLIAIAGSAGKTTTKELLAAILQGKWKNILKTQGSQNGFVGIPMTLLELKPQHDAAIIEIGIDEVGTMEQHIALVSPGYSILTSIGPEHLENLMDVPTIAREEGIALSHVAKTDGTVAIYLDDPWIRPHLTTPKEGRKIPYSLKGATSKMEMISGHLSENGKELTFSGLGIPETTIPMPLPGSHNASNLLGAITLAAGLGLNATEIKKGITFFQGAEGRSEIVSLPGALSVICDYYNAQPASMAAAFNLLHETARHSGATRPQWACLADMLELGQNEEILHRELASKILELEINHVLLLGPRMKALSDELRRKGFQGQLADYNSHAELASALTKGVRPGDVVLIKGSRGMKMEEVWKILEPFAKLHWSEPVESTNSPSQL
jgi:UDP-N-acetylmuramoyl-tripeptide--D-alanyl-D-alanine ligase